MLNSLLEIEGRPLISHPLGSHLHLAKDKHGLAKAVLKMAYRRRQEDQPSVEYPSDIEEDHLLVGNGAGNPILGGKISFQAGRGVTAGVEMEDDLGEIDNEIFALPRHKPPSQKSSTRGIGGFSTDFTTTVIGKQGVTNS